MYRQTSLLEVCASERLEVVRGDARDRELLKSLLKGADAVIPLACLTGAPLCDRDPWAAREVNLDAVRMILDLRSPRQALLYPNTNSGYGVGAKGKPCTEPSPLTPVSLYGKLKVEAEKAVLDAGNSLTFRFATLFGMSPRMRLDLLVNDFVWRACQDGFVVLFEAGFKRNYLHVRDGAGAFLHALAHFDRMKGRPYNAGLSDANLSKRELCEEIRKVLPRFVFVEAPVGEDPDKRDYIVSNDRIEAAGFSPRHSLEAGIRELVKGYRILPRHPMGNV
jgi:nucleoside-diphosphate-sugar epimerase